MKVPMPPPPIKDDSSVEMARAIKAAAAVQAASSNADGATGSHSVIELVLGKLESIDAKLGAIEQRLAAGDTAISLLEHRVGLLEKIVYGLVGLILLGVGGAIIALVVRGSHQ
jgi:hypothetical protein